MSETIQHPFRHGSARRTTFGYLTDDHPRLDRVQNTISAVCGTIASAAIVGIAVLTLWEVFCRTVFRAPQGWVPGLIEQALLVTAAFFGIVTAYRSGAHVAIVSLFNKFPTPVRKALLIFAYLVVTICLVVIMVTGWRAMQFSYSLGEVIPPGMADLSVPVWVWKSPIPIACALGVVVVLIDLYRELTSPWNVTATDYEPGDIEIPSTEDEDSADAPLVKEDALAGGAR